MSWTFTINSDGGSKGLLVSLSTAWAVKVYCACSSRSRVFVAWMLPVLSSMTKIVPAPSPDRIYLMFPSPESTSEWSWNIEGGGWGGVGGCERQESETKLKFYKDRDICRGDWCWQYLDFWWCWYLKRDRLVMTKWDRLCCPQANLENILQLEYLADAKQAPISLVYQFMCGLKGWDTQPHRCAVW